MMINTLQLIPIQENLLDLFLLVDGYGSRLSLKFIEYCLDLCHLWTVVFGLPHGTAYWQMGNSKTQNRAAKHGIVLEKRKLLEQKTQLCEPRIINASDIVPILMTVWPKSFDNIKGNKRAIAK